MPRSPESAGLLATRPSGRLRAPQQEQAGVVESFPELGAVLT